MKQNNNDNIDPIFIQERLRDMAEGLTEAIDREVARRQQHGLPIHVSDNGSVVDIQKTTPDSDSR